VSRAQSPVSRTLQEAIAHQRRILSNWLSSSLSIVAEGCREVWPDRQALERRLLEDLDGLPYCKYLYALDAQARQITANVTREGPLEEHFGRDRSDRAYLAEALAGAYFSLSEAYISRNKRRPSMTAVQRILDAQGRLLGYLGADFDLRELPATQDLYRQPGEWVQLKGDPAVRAGLFLQQRVESPMDRHMDAVLSLLTELMTVHGAFHGKLHFSSSRLTVWFLDDPYSYRIHGIDDLLDPDLCLAYPRHSYPQKARVPADAIPRVLRCFRDLRFMDETLYLRSGSLNLFNGMVGLTFSCDGSHYMPWDELLEKDVGFWLGTPG
jgi:hypothetical protein